VGRVRRAINARALSLSAQGTGDGAGVWKGPCGGVVLTGGCQAVGCVAEKVFPLGTWNWREAEARVARHAPTCSCSRRRNAVRCGADGLVRLRFQATKNQGHEQAVAPRYLRCLRYLRYRGAICDRGAGYIRSLRPAPGIIILAAATWIVLRCRRSPHFSSPPVQRAPSHARTGRRPASGIVWLACRARCS